MREDICSVSIVVPVCNVQKYLRQCLDSLTDQTLQDIQIICIDDGSTDDSLSILQEYGSRDSRMEIISKPNAGYGHTMNMGFAAAKGEYVGIVESDDFAEIDMFEKMYNLAKSNDADVVKSNFFQYTTNTIPDNDPIVDNLAACRFSEAFDPLQDQNIFLTQPAIWSALYKRSFLEKEKISFLETPGASFQDTSFNFKVFAAAKRVVLTDDAFLHYRIDNANSSVKSLKKVFCICDEYQEIWEYASSNPEIFDALKCRIPQIQFGGYLWNLERLTPALQYQFYEKFVEEFQTFRDKGLLNKDYFDQIAWEKLNGMLADPKGYFRKSYGPIEIEKTFLVLLSRKACEGKSDRPIRALLELLEEKDEMYVAFSNQDLSTKPWFCSLLADESRLHIMESEIDLHTIARMNLDSIRGNELVVVEIGGPDWTPNKTSKLISDTKKAIANSQVSSNELWAVGKWSKSSLRCSNLPVWLPLLFAGFYVSVNDSDTCRLPSWQIKLNEENVSNCNQLSEIVEEYKFLYQHALDIKISARSSLRDLMSALWSRVSAAFDQMAYDDRAKYGAKPSPLELEPWFISNEQSGDNSSIISVVIPIYNSEKYISQCLDSVLQQSIQELEIVCIDDGSTDDSLDIVCDYAKKDSRIKVISQFNGGAGAARNRGIEAVAGEYLAFIDPDDTYPGDDVLASLLEPIKDHKAKLSAGSFVMEFPNGSKKMHFGGEQHFYSIRTEGMQSLRSLQTDYGWIRFLYHRSIFEEGKVRFPEYRWYEDPVFFTEVMEYCDEFYGIEKPVYCYKADYKESSWNVVKVRDMVRGIAHNLAFAKENTLSTLYTTLVLRLNRDYYSAIMEYIYDEEVFSLLSEIQGNLDISLIHDVCDNGWNTYLIKPFFDLINYRKNAVVRLAERVGDSSFYKKLQAIREQY